MMNNNNYKKSWIEKLSDFISGKGFYLVVLICVAAIALSGYYLVQGVRGGLDETLDQPVSGSAAIVDQPSAKPSAQVTASPSAAPSAKPSAAPKPSTAPTAQPSEQPSAALSLPPAASPAALVFTWPVNGTVIADFSMEALVYNETMGHWRTHDGLDLAVSQGTQVLAAADGTVIAVYDHDFMGTTVEIDHGDGLTSQYANLAAKPTVSEGDQVKTGSVIGSVGATAIAESGRPAHLHFTIFRDGKPIDPRELLP